MADLGVTCQRTMRWVEYRIDGPKDVPDWIGYGQISLNDSKAQTNPPPLKFQQLKELLRVTQRVWFSK